LEKNRCKKNYHVIGGKRNGAEQARWEYEKSMGRFSRELLWQEEFRVMDSVYNFCASRLNWQ